MLLDLEVGMQYWHVELPVGSEEAELAVAVGCIVEHDLDEEQPTPT